MWTVIIFENAWSDCDDTLLETPSEKEAMEVYLREKLAGKHVVLKDPDGNYVRTDETAKPMA